MSLRNILFFIFVSIDIKLIRTFKCIYFQVKSQKVLETQFLHANADESSALHVSKSVEGTKLLYILVQDEPAPGAKDVEQAPSYRYTRPMLASTLQLMGCKPRHSIKVCSVSLCSIQFQ